MTQQADKAPRLDRARRGATCRQSAQTRIGREHLRDHAAPTSSVACSTAGNGRPTPRRDADLTGTADATVPEAAIATSRRRRARKAIDGYILLTEQGRGGMGVVRRAWDPRRRRIVALKQLVRDSPQARRRFEREALLAASLEHPGIVAVYDRGRAANGAPFYTMELIRGRSLRALIEQTQTLAARLRLLDHVAAVCDAMAYAHGRAIIHRDLKPSNVMVGRRGETVVIDWGLGKQLGTGRRRFPTADAPANGGRRGTASATTLCGTPVYMAPEQARRADAVDARADVFSLGAMLYHVITGTMPFDGSTIRARRERGLPVEPERLSIAAPDTPAELAAVVERAMAMDPRARFADAGTLGEALRQVRAGLRDRPAQNDRGLRTAVRSCVPPIGRALG